MPALAPTTLALTFISAVNSDYSAGAFTNPSFGFGKKPLTPVAPEDPPAATNVFKPAHSPAFCAALKQLSSPPRRFSPFTGAYQTDNPMHLVYGPISEWDTSRVTDMSRAFAHASFFNAGELRARETERQRDGETERQRDRETERQRDRKPLSHSSIDPPSVLTTLHHTTRCPPTDLSRWNTSQVTSFYGMFEGAATFNSGEWPSAMYCTKHDTRRLRSCVLTFPSNGPHAATPRAYPPPPLLPFPSYRFYANHPQRYHGTPQR